MIMLCAPVARAAAKIASSLASGRAYAIESRTVPANRYDSCGTTPSWCR